MLLAAGLGRRLRPLTDVVPKPLLPLRGRPVAAYTLARLVAFGCEAVAVNLHHLGEEIRRQLGDSFAGMPIRYSPEPEIQGTLGALRPLQGFLREAELVVVVNGDSVCSWPLRRLLRHHLRTGAAASLLVSRRVDPRPFGGGIEVDAGGRITALRPAAAGAEGARRRVFLGLHVFRPELLRGLERNPADVVEHLYEPLLADGARLQAVETRRRWHDLGTPERYLRAALELAARPWPRRLVRRSWVSPRATVAAGATVRGSAVEEGARVQAGAEIAGSLLLPGSRVEAGSRVVDSILGFGVRLAADTSVNGRLVTKARTGQAPGKRDSVLGGLVMSPLGGPGRGAAE